LSKALTGKTAVVTGAAQGIGRATAVSYARAGALTWAIDRNADRLQELEATDGIRTLALDVVDAEGIAAAAARIGPVDVLVNGVGWAHVGDILECGLEDWDRTFDINVRSMYLMIRAFLPGMIARRGGSIINIASVVSSVGGAPKRCAYAASKGAVIGLTKSIASDFMGQGVRCNAVCPGTIDTPSLAERVANHADPAAAKSAFIARQPVGRLGRAEEVAELCVYLASDLSAFVVGTSVVIDGGMTVN
jgi:2-keto-3-deoxy-L-fuconate dehydrogenase